MKFRSPWTAGSLMASVAIHLAVIGTIAGLGAGRSGVGSPAGHWVQLTKPVASPMVPIEFVDSPQTPAPPAPGETIPPRMISDKTTGARDQAPADRPVTGKPRLEGKRQGHSLPKPLSAPASRAAVQKPQAAPTPSPEKPLPPSRVKHADGIAVMSPSPSKPTVPKEVTVDLTMRRSDVMGTAASRSDSDKALSAGTPSFAATGSDLGRYIKEMKEKIWIQWFPFVAMTYHQNISTEIVVHYRIMPDGQLQDLVAHRVEGDAFLAEHTLAAIRKAAPFGPLPLEALEQSPDRSLRVVFTFYYG